MRTKDLTRQPPECQALAGNDIVTDSKSDDCSSDDVDKGNNQDETAEVTQKNKRGKRNKSSKKMPQKKAKIDIWVET